MLNNKKIYTKTQKDKEIINVENSNNNQNIDNLKLNIIKNLPSTKNQITPIHIGKIFLFCLIIIQKKILIYQQRNINSLILLPLIMIMR